MSSVQPLDPDLLCQNCEPDQFPFETTKELDPLTEIVGQKRAIEAMRFGVSIRREGYNLFAMGSPGTGKFSAISQFLEKRAAAEPVPADWCYVNNFEQPYKPHALQLPAGRGLELCRDMTALVEQLHSVISTSFGSEDYKTLEEVIHDEFGKRQEQAFNELNAKGEGHGLALVRTQEGWAFAPIQEGQVISPAAFQNLPAEEQARIKEAAATLETELRETMERFQIWEGEKLERIKALKRGVADLAVGHLVDQLRQKYREQPEVGSYLDALQEDVVENHDDFLKQQEQISGALSGAPLPRAAQGPPSFRRYQVNVLVDHTGSQGAPVVYEDHPVYPRLFGQAEYTLAGSGALVTDFNLIKEGALHQANGGYLVLDARKLLAQPYSWEQLKRALKANQITIETPARVSGMANTVSLSPEPIPLSVKIILIGDRSLYYTLHQLDPDFGELFKVAVDFAEEMGRNSENNLWYARLIRKIVVKEGLCHLDRAAVARVIEHSARLAGHSGKLSLRVQGIADLLREADFWAAEAGHEIISLDDVQRAIDAQIYRVDQLRERMQEQIEEDTIFIDTDGEKVGQVNGLSVLSAGNFSFGRPTRITAQIRPGKGEVIDIEREVALGGPLHSKGVLILSGFLGARYTLNRPLSLSASLVFEQSYGGVDGDSASSTELYALLSALADIPIRQSLAVTGSVNQHGQVQAIGGANEKIEGFFDLCRVRGLTGQQGVLIPASNVKHLMLRRDVIDSVAAGQFHIFPVETIDQGIEILTGVPAGERNDSGQFPEGSINQRVEARLNALAEVWRSYGLALGN